MVDYIIWLDDAREKDLTALEEVQVMSLLEGVVVSISMGLSFIGLRLDPKIIVSQAAEPPTMPKYEQDPFVGTTFLKIVRDEE